MFDPNALYCHGTSALWVRGVIVRDNTCRFWGTLWRQEDSAHRRFTGRVGGGPCWLTKNEVWRAGILPGDNALAPTHDDEAYRAR